MMVDFGFVSAEQYIATFCFKFIITAFYWAACHVHSQKCAIVVKNLLDIHLRDCH